MGASVLVGGLRHGTQKFNPKIAGANAALLVLAAGRAVRAGRVRLHDERSEPGHADRGVGARRVVLMAGYVLSLVYQFTNPKDTLGGHGEPEGTPARRGAARSRSWCCWALRRSWRCSRRSWWARSSRSSTRSGSSAFFVGVVLIPTIGNLAEHLVAVQLAAKDKMEFAMAVTFGSSLQVALFVAPVLVLIGVVVGQPMDLVFTPLEVAAVAAAVGISALIALDGESNWLEGALLMLVYADPGGVVLRVRLTRRAREAAAREGTRAAADGCGRGQAATSSAHVLGLGSSSASSDGSGSNPAVSGIGSSAGASPSAEAWAASESAACCAS